MEHWTQRMRTQRIRSHIRWLLVGYDAAVYLLSCFLMLVLYHPQKLTLQALAAITLSGAALLFIFRYLLGVYRQIWRYGGVRAYLRLVLADTCAFAAHVLLDQLAISNGLTFDRNLALVAIDLLGVITIRMLYACVYKDSEQDGRQGAVSRWLLQVLGASDAKHSTLPKKRGIPVAIVGAGRVGAALAEELINSPASVYRPCFFVDIDKSKTGRDIYGLRVYAEDEVTWELIRETEVQEIIIALPQLDPAQRKQLYDTYQPLGCRIKTYDFPLVESAGRRSIREFDIEELLFRSTVEMDFSKTAAYYRNKVILVTGGGGSIGSELCRQLAKMQPKKLVILDIAENGAYDLQQELRLTYSDKLPLSLEIASICDRKALERVFAEYHPQVVVMAAAHKHVPLMEKNCIEAVRNNVFGTLNTIEVSEAFGAERVIMVSTDKAVNPTNIMGATKRMCEMIVQSRSAQNGKTTFSMTRFGNVLGSAGSVIPLFKKQIAMGGPVTVTDRRIMRYFMTIPEASQLVLESGAIAKNGELFVLDMGQPVKIVDLAENMIRLSGAHDVEIVETGLRPGEKLYEEPLMKAESLDRTANRQIFIERDQPLSPAAIEEKLELLRRACESGSDETVRAALMQAVPTFHRPEEVNCVGQAASEDREPVTAS